MVRSFVDGIGDGTGDLADLISRLDYLQWLGIDALWISPVLPVAAQGRRYDVTDYRLILPEFGTLEEFKEAVTKVHECIARVMRFWLNLDGDGYRPDAGPYLYESDEGNGEGEPPTHEYVRQLRAMVDRDSPGRVLIAEANQGPREVSAFFGSDSEPECHLTFDFPVRPRIFCSLCSQRTAEARLMRG